MSENVSDQVVVEQNQNSSEDKRWVDVMCDRSTRLRKQISRLASMMFVLNRHEMNFTTNTLAAPSNVLALVVYTLPPEEDHFEGVFVTGWRLKPENGTLVAHPGTFALRKALSRRKGIDKDRDAALRDAALEIEDTRRQTAETQLDIAHLYKVRRENRGLTAEEQQALREKQANLADLLEQPRFPRLMAGLRGVDPRTDLKLESFLALPAFRRNIIELSRHYFERTSLRTDELCATTENGIDLDMLWELVTKRIGPGGLDMLVTNLLNACTREYGFLTFFPADLLPEEYEDAIEAQFIDLTPVLRDPNGAVCRSRIFTWDIGKTTFREGLQLQLPGARADFASVPPRSAHVSGPSSEPAHTPEAPPAAA